MPPDEAAPKRAFDRAAHLVHAQLEARREAISRELRAIPPPVPACDVNFNRLLEERAGVIDALQQLRRLLAAGDKPQALLELGTIAAGLGAATEHEVARILADSTS